jgi:hypothetical protein
MSANIADDTIDISVRLRTAMLSLSSALELSPMSQDIKEALRLTTKAHLEASRGLSPWPMRMAKIFYSDGTDSKHPDGSTVAPGWYFQLNMGEPAGPFRCSAEAEAELRFVARDLEAGR